MNTLSVTFDLAFSLNLGAMEKTPKPQAADRRQRVQSVETGMLVLKALSQLGGAASLTTLSAAVGEHSAKVHRYLASLVMQGLVAQSPATQHYHLGPEAVLIGMAALRQCDPVRLGEQFLVGLREDLELTSFIAVMGNRGPTVMRIEEPVAPVTINVRAGSVLSVLWSASGRAFLGFSDDPSVRHQAEADLAVTASKKKDLFIRNGGINALCQKIRAQGFAEVEDTFLAGISAVSAPIFDATGKPIAVLTALGARRT